MRALLLLSFTAALSLAACEDTAPECVPAEKASCYCNTGGPGEKVCEPNGLDYGACECTVDAGVDGPSEEPPAAR